MLPHHHEGFGIPKVFVDTSAAALADSDAHNQRGGFEGKDASDGTAGWGCNMNGVVIVHIPFTIFRAISLKRTSKYVVELC